MKQKARKSAPPNEAPELDAETAAFAREHEDLINGLFGDVGGLMRELPEEERETLAHPTDAFFKIADRLPPETHTSDASEAFPCPQCSYTIGEEEDSCSQCGWTFKN